jgi:Fe-S oxidoreductase
LAPKVGLELVELESVTCCGAGDPWKFPRDADALIDYLERWEGSKEGQAKRQVLFAER